MAERHAVGVCGFGRCGSTMLMAMLDAGGCPPAGDVSHRSYELTADQPPTSITLIGHAVKLLELPSEPVPAAPAWRFVWLDRDLEQQAASQVKFLRAVAPELLLRTDDMAARRQLMYSYTRDRPKALGALRRLGPVLALDYERVLRGPRKTARLLRRDIWPALDVDAAAGVVHERDGTCRPDLSFETTGLAGVARDGVDRG